MDLVRGISDGAVGKGHSKKFHPHIYVLDDGIMTYGHDRRAQSIGQVANACLPSLDRILNEVAPDRLPEEQIEVILGGWSYGGVVATELARQLLSTVVRPHVLVKTLLLFDSPLRAPREVHTAADIVISTKDAVVSNENEGSDLSVIQRRTNQHFSYCTELLKLYHQRAMETTLPLRNCRIIDFRPMESQEYDCGISAVEEFTLTESIRRHHVPGSHWTMLFGENTAFIVRVILEDVLNLQ